MNRSRTTVLVLVLAVAMIAVGVVALQVWPLGGNAAAEPTASPTATATPTPSLTPTPSPTPSPSPTPTADPTPVFSKNQYLLDHPVSPWVVVNKARPLDPLDYEPRDLVSLRGIPGGNDQTLREEAAEALFEMHDAVLADGLRFSVSTAYRGYDMQTWIYQGHVNNHGQARADTFSARPGYSEHQTGWAVDIYDDPRCRLQTCFGDTEVYAWIEQHAADYGFIVRYLRGDMEITGFQYEPWHLRYVGVDLATHLREEEVTTLEEFFDLPPAPDYVN